MEYQLYGLQRSGTNILECFILDNFHIQVNIEGKHNRINQINDIKTIEDLDNFTGGPKKYIVIFKNIYSWLLSIEMWANKKNWDKKDKMDFIDEYIQYYKKWQELKHERILIVFYEDFLKNYTNINSPFMKKLSKFFDKKDYGTRKRREVKCSGRWGRNENYYIQHKYLKRYTKQELDIIKNKLNEHNISPY